MSVPQCGNTLTWVDNGGGGGGIEEITNTDNNLALTSNNDIVNIAMILNSHPPLRNPFGRNKNPKYFNKFGLI